MSESTPLALSSLQWAKERFIPTSGYWPALLGDRPDCTHFLADHHLVYGDQLRDLMLREGVAAGSVKSVGSLTYDAARGRSRESDLEQVRRLLGDWRDDEHLVVVGTEALPGQMDEIAEAVRALLELRCVYVVIKVHPSDDPAPFERLAQAQASRRIKVICQCDLHALLHAARLLICIMSNIILIAAQLGTPSLVFDPTNKRAQLDFVKEGGCFGCFKAVDLKAMIQGLLTDSELRAKAIAKLGVGMLRFNAFNDGQSATRVAKEIVRVADRSAGEANAAKLCG